MNQRKNINKDRLVVLSAGQSIKEETYLRDLKIICLKMEDKCDKTLIHLQKSCTSPLSKNEGSWLPHNTQEKGKVTKRKHVHRQGRFKGKVEWDYYINVDWKGNRKPNNLYRKYLWEVYNQRDLPKGYVVTTIDGNPDNLVIENLELITRRELLRRNTGK